MISNSETFYQFYVSLLFIAIGFFLRFKNTRLLLLLLSVLAQVRYLLWRGIFTLDTATAVGLAVTLTLYLAECYGLLQNIFFTHQTARPRRRIPPEPTVFPTVDFFVPIVNEPLEILRRTLVGCLAQDYPSEKVFVHVLDDGRREEVRKLADALGCNYIRRQDRSHAKAGNLNHALTLTRGECIAIFDVDHVPVRSFLKRTVGFLEDEKVAFVQTPHHFYNPDIFQKNLRLEKEIENDQELFFRVIQPGRDAHNSAFFAGSSAVFRRKALEEIGGFRTDTLTEDLHTSLVLHARGWKSCYLDETLSAGLTPESLRSYLKQRERWAIGAVQTFFRDNPLFKRSLSWAQRLHYFASIYYFLHGIPRVVYLAAPVSFLLFGVSPIVARPFELIHYFFSYYVISVIVTNTVGKGYRKIFWSDVYESLMCFSLSKAVVKAFVPGSRSAFFVTPKGEAGQLKRAWREMTPHLVLACALVVGVARGLLVRPENQGALAISSAWAVFNILLLFLVINSALERPQRRIILRLRRKILCVVKGPDREAKGYTSDVSEDGVAVRLVEEMYFPESDVDVELIGSYGEVTRLRGSIRRQEKDEEGVVLGIRFRDAGEGERHSLIRQMYSPPESWQETDRAKGGFAKDMMLLGKGMVRPWRKDRELKRRFPRISHSQPCSFIVNGAAQRAYPARTVDISYGGLSILLEDMTDGIDVARGSRVQIDGVGLKVEVVARSHHRGKVKLHLRVTAIESGDTLWRDFTLL